jgi:preprotein translocase subunit SecF
MIDFMKYKKIYFVISGIFLIPGIISLVLFGLKPSIDFVGGTLLELKLKENGQVLISNVQTIDDRVTSVQKSGEKTYLLKTKPLNEGEKNELKSKFEEKFGEAEELRFETVGPTLGRELLVKTLIAIVLAAGFILAYVAYQFKDKMYGICAILAMFHDSLILLGSFSLLGHFAGVEVDTLFVTALLTILSFSVHDTIVVYDRIRESLKKGSKEDFEQIVNRAVNETLMRSLNNSLTIIFMLLALLLLGGATIKWFVVALLIGTVSGTYSSTFTAAPLLLVWKSLEKRRA